MTAIPINFWLGGLSCHCVKADNSNAVGPTGDLLCYTKDNFEEITLIASY